MVLIQVWEFVIEKSNKKTQRRRRKSLISFIPTVQLPPTAVVQNLQVYNNVKKKRKKKQKYTITLSWFVNSSGIRLLFRFNVNADENNYFLNRFLNRTHSCHNCSVVVLYLLTLKRIVYYVDSILRVRALHWVSNRMLEIRVGVNAPNQIEKRQKPMGKIGNREKSWFTSTCPTRVDVCELKIAAQNKTENVE